MIDPRIIHQLEQATGPYSDFARTLGVYYRALLAEDFTPEEAMQIVLDYQSTLVALSVKPKQGGADGNR